MTQIKGYTVRERILARVDIVESGCWVWIPDPSRKYPKLRMPANGEVVLGKAVLVHRASYRAFNGPIPAGYHIDHVCRNTRCVNPNHLEAVTPRENTMRSPTAVAAINARKDRCPNGHDYSVRADGSRCCKTCLRDWRKTYTPHCVDVERARELRASGLSYKKIATILGVSPPTVVAAAGDGRVVESRKFSRDRAQELLDAGLTFTAIGRELGVDRASIRWAIKKGQLHRCRA